MYLHHGEIDKSFPKILPNAPNESFLALESDQPLTLFGHTHVQFERQIGGTRYINPEAWVNQGAEFFMPVMGLLSTESTLPNKLPTTPPHGSMR